MTRWRAVGSESDSSPSRRDVSSYSSTACGETACSTAPIASRPSAEVSWGISSSETSRRRGRRCWRRSRARRARDLVVAEVLDHPRLDDVDLLLRLLVDRRSRRGSELDRVLLVLEELELEGAAQAVVRVPLELLALDRERADVVHDLAAEVVFAVLGDLDLLFDGAHEPLVGLDVLAGEAVLHLLLQVKALIASM
jgi:hypothetical protein